MRTRLAVLSSTQALIRRRALLPIGGEIDAIERRIIGSGGVGEILFREDQYPVAPTEYWRCSGCDRVP